MKLKEFMTNLNDLVKTNPEALEYDVITSKDDEGNGFNTVYYAASIGFCEDSDMEFIPKGVFDVYDIDPSSANAVCLN